jgi:hypothetical protein
MLFPYRFSACDLVIVRDFLTDILAIEQAAYRIIFVNTLDSLSE